MADKIGGSIEVNRFSMDSYPIVSTLKLNGVAVNLDGWNTFLYYSEKQADGTFKEIGIVGVNGNGGVAKFYPRELYCYDITNSIPYRGLVVAGVHPYSIIRSKVAYEKNAVGNYVLVSGEYIAYDAGAHAGKTRYSDYTETMTHAVGDIVISARSGL